MRETEHSVFVLVYLVLIMPVGRVTTLLLLLLFANAHARFGAKTFPFFDYDYAPLYINNVRANNIIMYSAKYANYNIAAVNPYAYARSKIKRTRIQPAAAK